MAAEHVEILVHVAAPSRVLDDDRYRQLAQAYLNFEPAGPQGIQELPSSEHGPDSQELQDHLVYEPDFIADSQNLSFNSALDNRSSPRLRVTRAHEAEDRRHVIPSSQSEGPVRQPSWVAPLSQISDSYPMPTGLFVSPTRLLEQYMGRAFSSHTGSPSPIRRGRISSQRSPERPVGLNIQSSLPEVSSQQEESLSSLSILTPQQLNIPSSLPRSSIAQASASSQNDANSKQPKVIPVTPQIPTKRRSIEAESAEDWTGADITHISSSDLGRPAGSASSRAESEPPPKRTRVTAVLQSSSIQSLIRSSSDTSTPRKLSRKELTTLDILPPSPPVGIDTLTPTSFVSAKLAEVAHRLSSRYRSTYQREIDPLERGYWIVDCTIWPKDIQSEAWAFLTDYLQSGLAGWGVWCRRDKIEQYSWIRLYCWGHVAKHMYLLLYLSSGRCMKTTGAVWKDAEGQEIIEVPPIERPQ